MDEQANPGPSNWDLSSYNWYQNARISITGSLLRNVVDTISVPYHYRRYSKDRHSVNVQLGTYPNGEPIPPLRILIYLPHKWIGGEALKAAESAANIDQEDSRPRSSFRKGVLVHIAGGGFTMCRPENEGHLCRTLCDSIGCITISPDYVKAPQHPYPQALNQLYALLQWIAQPSHQNGLLNFLEKQGTPSNTTYLPLVDITKIALSGGSSGGNLAASICVRAIQEHLTLPSDAQIVCLILNYPMLDISIPYHCKLSHVPNKSKVLPRWLTRLFLDGYLQDLRLPENNNLLKDPLISPGLASLDVLKRFPEKVVLIMAENDYLCWEGEVFAKRLIEVGYVEGDTLFSKTFEKVAHGFDITPHFSAAGEAENAPARTEAWAMITRALTTVL